MTDRTPFLRGSRAGCVDVSTRGVEAMVMLGRDRGSATRSSSALLIKSLVGRRRRRGRGALRSADGRPHWSMCRTIAPRNRPTSVARCLRSHGGAGRSAGRSWSQSLSPAACSLCGRTMVPERRGVERARADGGSGRWCARHSASASRRGFDIVHDVAVSFRSLSWCAAGAPLARRLVGVWCWRKPSAGKERGRGRGLELGTRPCRAANWRPGGAVAVLAQPQLE
jgi:hypothetical protein